MTVSTSDLAETEPKRGGGLGRSLRERWALWTLGLFALLIVGLFFFYRPPMEESITGDTFHPIRGLIGYPHGPGAAQEPYDEKALDRFVEETIAETYAKARIDRIKLLLMGLLIGLIPLGYYRGRSDRFKRLGQRVNKIWDPYTFGTVSGLLLVGVIIPTGTILGLFYSADAEKLYESMAGIVQSPILSFLRNLHLWASEAFLIFLFLHTARIVSTRAYFGGRKLVWVLGGVLLAISWATFLIGTFIRGDQEAFEAWVHMMALIRFIPLIGDPIADFFSGPFAVMRLYIFHIVITTIALLLILAPHVLMQKVYVHVQRRWRTAVRYTLGLTALLAVLSLLVPAPFLSAPYHDLEITKPPWPYYFLYAWENIGGAVSMTWSPLLILVPLLLLPYALEQLPLARRTAQRVGDWVFYGGVLITLGLSYWVAASGIVAHVFE